MRTKVVVIDDDVEMTDLLKIVLEPDSFEVFAANSSREGIDAVRSQNPDVVVLNLFMPELDGWSACQEIRGFSKVPILILSAISSPDLVARALDEGADDFLVKPMPSGVLIANLKRLARRARAEKDAVNTKYNYYQ